MNYNKYTLDSNVRFGLATKFQNMLAKSNYKFIYNSILGSMLSVDVWSNEHLIEEKLNNCTEKDAALVRFLMAGIPQRSDIIANTIGNEGVEFLISCGYASERNGTILSNGYVIVPVDSLFLIVSTPGSYSNATCRFADIYIGQDSLSMLQMVTNRTFDNVLDLCAGSGIQGLHLSDAANSVTAVEINDIAYHAAQINAFINGCASKYSIFKGDLYEALEDKNEKFDCILCNPPYVPTPDGLDCPVCGDGGEDGLKIVKQVIAGYDQFLKKNGCAYMVLECIGDAKQPYLINDFKQMIDNGVLNVKIFNTVPIQFQADASAKMSTDFSGNVNSYLDYYEQYIKMFAKHNATDMYSIVIEYINSKNDLQLNIIRSDAKWNLSSEFELNKDVVSEQSDLLFVDMCKVGCKKISLKKEIFDLLIKYNKVSDMINSFEPKELIRSANEIINAMIILENVGIVIKK